MGAHSSTLGLAAILIAVFAAYAGTLGDWFISDDFYYLRAARVTPFWTYVRASFDYTHPDLVTDFLYRPLSLLNFLWLYHAFGLHAWAYRLFGLAVHMANTVLLWRLALKLTRRVAVSHAAALVFGLHPTYAPAVAWISNSMSLIAMFCALGSLLFFLQYLDGGARSLLRYGAALAGLLLALFLHPETVIFVPVLAVVYILLPSRSLRELRSRRTWLPLVPYVIVGVAFLALHAWIREHVPLQLALYTWGPHIVHNFLGNMALVGNPFGADSNDVAQRAQNRTWARDLTQWRTLLPIVGVAMTSLYLLVRDLRRPNVKTIAVIWFYASLVPISTSPVLGATPRKLYIAGPGFALMLALAAVSVSDWLRVVGRQFLAPNSQPTPGAGDDIPSAPAASRRVGAAGLLSSGLMALVMIALSFRIVHVTSPDFMSLEAHNGGISSQTEESLLDQMLSQYPSLPRGSELILIGLPSPLRNAWGLHPTIRAALDLYYPGVVVGALRVHRDLLLLPPVPAGTGRYVVQLDCPGNCPAADVLSGLAGKKNYLTNTNSPSVWQTWRSQLQPAEGGLQSTSSQVAYGPYTSTAGSALQPKRGKTYAAVVWVKGMATSAGDVMSLSLRENGKHSPETETNGFFRLTEDWQPIVVARTIGQRDTRFLTVHLIKFSNEPKQDSFLFRDAQLSPLG